MAFAAYLCISSAQIIKMKVLHLFLTNGLEPIEVVPDGSAGVVVTPIGILGIFLFFQNCFKLVIDNQLSKLY